MLLTYRYRVKNHLGELNRQARAVSFAWNYCNDRQRDALKWDRKWLTGFDLTYLVAGSSKELGLRADSINAVCAQYAKSRQQHKRPYLRYRGKKSLGWVPFKASSLKRKGDAFRFGGHTFRVFLSRPLVGKIKDGGNFSQDARGNWFLNVVVEVPDVQARPIERAVGIDLGLKDFAALSTGEKVSNRRHLAKIAERLATAQRARKKRQARNLHIKCGNARRDFLHKLSRNIVTQYDYIAVGNVNSAKLAKTSMAKSVNDASWSAFRTMLAYKSIANGATYQEVSERFTSQVCSACGCLPASRPKGIADLEVRHWVCSECGAIHDRDVNAALNILVRSGHRALAEGIAA